MKDTELKTKYTDFSIATPQAVEAPKPNGIKISEAEEACKYLCNKYRPVLLEYVNYSDTLLGRLAIYPNRRYRTAIASVVAFEDKIIIRFFKNLVDILKEDDFPIMHPEVGTDIEEAGRELMELLRCRGAYTPSRLYLHWHGESYREHEDRRVTALEDMLCAERGVPWKYRFLRSIRSQILSGRHLSEKQFNKLTEIAAEYGFIPGGAA